MSTITADHTHTAPTLEQASGRLMELAAGYVGHRTVTIGLRHGLLEALRTSPDGRSVDSLAEALELDPFYVGVWCRAALAAGVLRLDGGRYRLAEHLDTLLLDDDSPAAASATFTLLEQPEVFDRFEASLASGERAWWDDASAEFITNVGEAGRPFYTRLVPGGLERIPGLADELAAGARILDTACGTGLGVVRLAETYPGSTVVGADGDQASLDLARDRVEDAGVADRVDFLHTPLEELSSDEPFTLVVNNISMHECRDIDAVTANINRVLEPGGCFVISDLPFPEEAEGLRTVPGRVMTGIQFWEAQIDDQLLPRRVYDDLLERHGFSDIGSFELAPVHAVTYGRA